MSTVPCRLTTPDPEPEPDNTVARGVREPADTQAVPDPTITGSTDRSRVTGHTEDAMANFAQSLKDPKILMLQAEFNSAHKAVDEKKRGNRQVNQLY